MKILFFLLSFSLCCENRAQKNNSSEFLILQEAIETEVFQQFFGICKDDSEILIIDTTKRFENFTSSVSCGVNIRVTSSSVSSKLSRVLTIYRFDYHKQFYKLYFHEEFTGAMMSLKFKMKKDKTILQEVKKGAF